MRRIDLICKLAGPFFISIIDGFSTEIAIMVNFGINVVSVVVEYYAIAKVYKAVPALQQPKKPANERRVVAEETRLMHNWRHVKDAASIYARDISSYFHHRAFLPSFSCALLYLTVLSFSGQMVTFLLASGYSSSHVGGARTFSVVLEIAATWTAPMFMARIGPIRAGIWLINWQILCLGAAISAFWGFTNATIAASGLVVGTILSRIGLRGFDLCAQMIVQEVCQRVTSTFHMTFDWSDQFTIRKLKPSLEARFPRSKPHGRIYLKYVRTQRPLFGFALSIFSGRF